MFAVALHKIKYTTSGMTIATSVEADGWRLCLPEKTLIV
jgi:hypothetical protein